VYKRQLKDHETFARKSEKSMNSEIGLPLTIIGAQNAWYSVSGWVRNILLGLNLILFKAEYPNCLVLEIGADHPGDIKSITKWLHPDVAVITKVSRMPVHVEFFKSPEEVFEEKSALALAVKDGGTLVLFADDEKVSSIGNMIQGKKVRVLNYGINNPATVFGSEYSCSINSGITFVADLVGEKASITIPNVAGQTYMFPILASVAVGKACDITLSNMVKSLKEYEPPKGRMNIIEGMNGSMIIDDTYNSSPDAVMSALQSLKSLECLGRKIAVLGDMMELGKYSGEEHRKVGREVVGIADILVTVGTRSITIADEAIKSGMNAENVKSFDTSYEAGEYIAGIVGNGDIILVKGSQSPRLERISKALLRNPEKADKLLVRQEKEWLEKK